MEREFNSNNTCYIQGEIITEPKMYIKDNKSRYFKIDVKVARKNEGFDTVALVFNKDDLKDTMKIGEKIAIKGQLRTDSNETSKTIENPYVLIERFNEYREEVNGNRMFLTGELINRPEYRVTKQNKSVCNATLKVETENRTDYVPFVTWGETAQILSTYEKGMTLELKARFSTKTIKKIEDDVVVEQTELPDISVYNIALK